MNSISVGTNGTRVLGRTGQNCLLPHELHRNRLARCKIIGLIVVVFALGLASPNATGAGRRPQTSQQVWTATPERVDQSNELYNVEMLPTNCDATDAADFEAIQEYARSNGYNFFYIKVKNFANDYIYIVWQKTFYIEKGETHGYFYFGGDLSKDINNPKPDDVVFPNAQFDKIIHPSKLLKNTGTEYIHGTMPEGENGIFITLRVMSRSPATDMPEKLTAAFTK